MDAPDRSRKLLSGVEARSLEWLNENHCSGDFEILVSRNCDQAKLLGYMTAVDIAAQHHAELAKNRSDIGGFDRETFDGFVTRARRVAEELEGLYSSDLGTKAIRQAAGPGTTAEFRNIPRQLRLIVSEAQTIYEKTSHRKKLLFDEAVGELCVYTKQTTGNWHDKEVSGLIGALTGRARYSGDDQRSWRHEHQALLDRLTRRVNESLKPRR
jgi:hypothetical protein